MKRTYIKDIKAGKVQKIQGFLENMRDKKAFIFIVLKDITGKMQIFIDKEKSPELAETVKGLLQDAVLTIEGEVIANEYVKLNGMEMIPNKITVEATADVSPIDAESSLDLRMDYRWLDLRSEKNQLMFKVQSFMVKQMKDFLYKNNFTEIHSPKIIGAASESGSDVFELKYFDRKAYLAQSPQFYKQMAMASGFDRVFEVGPVFRAEKSFTNKHATEFTGFDYEMSYITSYKDVMKMEEDMLTYALKNIKKEFGDKIQELFGIEVVVPKNPFPIIKLNDLYDELEARYGYKVAESDRGDLPTEAEKLCQQLAKDKYDHEFLFVTDYNAKNRAFYHMRKGNIAQGYDLIWRGVEVTTGAQREHRYEVLKKQAEQVGLAKDVEFYLEFFKYGCPPHGGLGIGVDRLTMVLLNLTIKDVMFIFRGPNRLNP
ncbi:MAG: aspartate--tRNA(Asn) ligase [Spirochaetales bacterium]